MDSTIPLRASACHSSLDGHELLVQGRARAQAEFTVVYERYSSRVYAYVRARIPIGDDAEDLTQQIFLRALSNYCGFRGQGDQVAAWLFRIARNVVTDYFRNCRPSMPWESLPPSLEPRVEEDLESVVMRAEELTRLREALLGLDDNRRDLLALRFGARLRAGEIAGIIGKSEAATRKQLLRTLHTLKELYDESS